MKYLRSIQGLRGIAALAVTIAHTHAQTGWWALYLHIDDKNPVFMLGAAGVDLFFVISGFIMVYTNAAHFGGVAGAKQFFARRIIRIVPLYWLATFGFMAFLVYWNVPWSASMTDKDIVCSFLFAACTRTDGTNNIPALGVGWSLNYEMMFYAFFAVAMLLPRRWALGSLLIFMTTMALKGATWGSLIFPVPYAVLMNTMLFEFIFGVVIGWIFIEKIRVPAQLATLALWLGIAGMVACLIFDLEPVIVQRPVRWGIPCALIVFGAVFREDKSEHRAWLWLAALGDMSYSLYLFHGLIMDVLRMEFTSALTPLGRITWLYAIFMVVASVAISYLIYRFVEQPMTRWLQKRPTQAGDRRNEQAQDSSRIYPMVLSEAIPTP